MKKIIIFSVIGLFSAIAGLILTFLHFNSEARQIWTLGGGGTATLIGVGLLIKAYFDSLKPDEAQVTVNAQTTVVTNPAPGSMLARNNAMLSQWDKTNSTKDKLKMLEISANAQKGS